jgi:hypothetical protein
MATAIQLLVGGSVMLALGPLRGERIPEIPPASAWFALGYLIVFGSIVAFTAYVYLLQTVRPSLATSYAYANPIVAVVLGVTLGSEVLTGPALIALPLILAGVGLVLLGSRQTQPDRDRRRLPSGRRALSTHIGGRLVTSPAPGAQHASASTHRPIQGLRSLTGKVFADATLSSGEPPSPRGGRR